MLLRFECLDKKISDIFGAWDVINYDFLLLNIVMNNVIFDIDILDFAMIDCYIIGDIEDNFAVCND